MFGTDVTVLDEEVLREDLRLDVRDGLEWVLGVEWTDVEEEEAEDIVDLALPFWPTRWLRLT